MCARTPRVDPAARERLRARFGDAVTPWLEAVPDLLEALSERWRLAVLEPIPRGSVAMVFHARGADGRRSVLKLSPDTARLGLEAAALAEWGPPRAPAVLAVDPFVGAMLLEEVEPGTALADAPAAADIARIAELVRGLHSGTGREAFPPVSRRVEALFDSSATLYTRYPTVDGIVPRALYERGRARAAALARDPVPAVLLHGDLTPVNVLEGGPARGLVAIDPAPCRGDAAFDAVDLILWRADEPAVIRARAEQLARATGGDAGRMLAWCTAFAAMVALELACQGPAPGPRPEALLALASAA